MTIHPPADVAELPVLALVLGDATGIGPEISARWLKESPHRDIARIVWSETPACWRWARATPA